MSGECEMSWDVTGAGRLAAWRADPIGQPPSFLQLVVLLRWQIVSDTFCLKRKVIGNKSDSTTFSLIYEGSKFFEGL